MERQKFNLKLLRSLYNFIQRRPEIRFVQALHALHIIGSEDNFYKESRASYETDLNEEWKPSTITEQDFYEAFDIKPRVSTYCKADCDVEPPAMVHNCPYCQDYERGENITWPFIYVDKLIEILIKKGCGCLVTETEYDLVKQEVMQQCIDNKDQIYNEIREVF